MDGHAIRSVVAEALDSIVEQLRDQFDYKQIGEASQAQEPLQSLLDQCEAIYTATVEPNPVRTIHHFACSGGTLVSRILGALPNTVVLSEIDPLSTMKDSHGLRMTFAPTDLVFLLRHSLRPADDTTIVAAFLAGLEAAKSGIEGRGQHLILRDHAHSQFCLPGINPANRPTLREMLATRFRLRSVLTVRHPLDSFLSLRTNRWIQFDPASLEEYATRYIAFLSRYDGVPIVLFEDFLADPYLVTQSLCEILDLRYMPFAVDLAGIVPMTGDSGRKQPGIQRLPRRPVPEDIEKQRHSGRNYLNLCAKFDYEP